MNVRYIFSLFLFVLLSCGSEKEETYSSRSPPSQQGAAPVTAEQKDSVQETSVESPPAPPVVSSENQVPEKVEEKKPEEKPENKPEPVIKFPVRGMVVFGDSVSRGILADTQAGVEISDGLKKELYKDLVDAAAGKKISQAEADEKYGRPALTAFTGDQSWSHYVMFSKSNPKFFRKVYAKSGAKGSTQRDIDFSTQIDEAFKDYVELSLEERPDYVVLEFGGNDFCSKTDPQSFIDGYREEILRLLPLFPDAVFLVTGIFNVPEIAEAMPASSLVLTVELLGQKRNFTCGEIRTSMCSRLKDPTDADREDLERMNSLLEAAVLEIKGKLNGNQSLIFASSTYKPLSITRDILAADCFHPNQNGHKAIAENTWKDLMTGLKEQSQTILNAMN
ncbi:MAG: hypothetical protein HQK54_08580 [Oligoflexales bacterium]|nr:hypothetical protein [Oligoflexales bacterium]